MEGRIRWFSRAIIVGSAVLCYASYPFSSGGLGRLFHASAFLVWLWASTLYRVYCWLENKRVSVREDALLGAIALCMVVLVILNTHW